MIDVDKLVNMYKISTASKLIFKLYHVQHYTKIALILFLIFVTLTMCLHSKPLMVLQQLYSATIFYYSGYMFANNIIGLYSTLRCRL